MTDLLPEMLNAAGLAAAYCGTDGWDGLDSWARAKGALLDGEQMPRSLMLASSKAIMLVVRQVEIELLSACLSAELGDRPLPLKDMWQDHAACAGMDTNLFFRPEGEGRGGRKGVVGEADRIRSAKKICAGCPVRAECLEFAIENECYGIWGGTDTRER